MLLIAGAGIVPALIQSATSLVWFGVLVGLLGLQLREFLNLTGNPVWVFRGSLLVLLLGAMWIQSTEADVNRNGRGAPR